MTVSNTASKATSKIAPKGQEDTAASGGRRRRYQPGTAMYGMTASKARVLWYIGQCGMLTTAQAARIAGITKKAAYKHLRDLFDLGLLSRAAIPYADLAPPEEDGSSLVWGPGENVHVPTREGLKWLADAKYLEAEEARRKPPEYGPRNKLFIAHNLLVRDVRVWLELCLRAHGGSVERSIFDGDAVIAPARPDAWFLYLLPGGGTAVLLAEADRGTELGGQWKEKGRGYETMMGSDALADATGGRRKARVLAVAPDAKRRDWIAGQLEGLAAAEWVYVCQRSDLDVGGLWLPFWRRPGKEELHPLLPEELFFTSSQ